MEPDTILWMDFETTGLDPERDEVLEIGCLATDLDLNVQTTFRMLHKPHHFGRVKQRMNEVVLEMHEANGLFEELEQFGRSWKTVYPCFLQYIGGVSEVTPILAGYGVSHMEARWLREHFIGDLSTLFTYYHYDVSVVRRMLQSVRPDKVMAKVEYHRAFEDAQNALLEWQYISNLMKQGLF